MTDQEITVAYRWTAKPGKAEELKAMYRTVLEQAESTEAGTLRFEVYEVEETGDLMVIDVFKDGQALGQHLGGTAAQYFPQLTEIATPGPFFFCGDVPEELVQAANGMNMGAVFGSRVFGFSRAGAVTN